MIIGIDASRYDAKEKTGVEFYSKYIIDELIKSAQKQKTHQLRFYSPYRLPRRCGQELNGSRILDENILIGQRIIPFKRLWTQFRLSWEMRNKAPDLLFVPSHTLPIFHPKKTVITIHDVAFIFFKKAYSFFQYHYLMWSTKYACKRATKIIVPSQATKDDLVGFFRCREDKIAVIHHGVDFDFKSEITKNKEKQILKQFKLYKKKFIFFVGRIETKKNLENIIEAFSEYKERYDHDILLVLAGKRGIGFKSIWQKIVEKNLITDIFLPGYVTEEEKDVLIKNAQFFIFISLYEGFGFPILEAFRAKTPVLTANTSAMKEIAEDAAMRVNPTSINEIAQGINKILNDEVFRRFLITKGEERLKSFDWGDAGRMTWRVVTEVSDS
ncbi:MAG: Glycosyl transferase group 1 [Candidatus Peregrinibacteria bacterium GW2011_GWA2_33_10]|nr:MAG: Glycosyl transferase group 1 [Candidatus Peregrinibacteria bacterium GW2011_GWA2_33_10]KKP41248.1 MAG: group 1 glycosyl transferase [Candidatus Peregrinibacteria bacterium GW2011_GWC2_33_13]OGJ50334.1 MAG: hypothetical protein A2229_02535 [Candidatus Peregrinibacteria bacterium RIFOXYA2_FULL_33_7]